MHVVLTNVGMRIRSGTRTIVLGSSVDAIFCFITFLLSFCSKMTKICNRCRLRPLVFRKIMEYSFKQDEIIRIG